MGGRYALLIATSHYKDRHFSRLATPASDVEALRDVLVDEMRGGFQVSLLLNRSHEKIRQEIDRFFKARRHDDVVLFYFSGHGKRDVDGKLCMTATDTNVDLLWSTSISADDLKLKMDRCDSGQQIVVLDCCYSGAFTQGSKGTDCECTGLDFFSKGQGRVVLTASDATQLAWESGSKHSQRTCSIFTGCLVDGLKSGDADINHDGVVTIDEWYDYTYERVRERCKQEKLKRFQTPLKHGTQKGDIVIARNPNASTAAVTVDPRMLELIANPYPQARLAAVEMLNKQLQDVDLAWRAYARKELEALSVNDDSRIVSSAAKQCLRDSARIDATKKGRAKTGSSHFNKVSMGQETVARSGGATVFPSKKARYQLLAVAAILTVVTAVTYFYQRSSQENISNHPVHVVPVSFQPNVTSGNSLLNTPPETVIEPIKVSTDEMVLPMDKKALPILDDIQVDIDLRSENELSVPQKQLVKAAGSGRKPVNIKSETRNRNRDKRKKQKQQSTRIGTSPSATPPVAPTSTDASPPAEKGDCPGCDASDLLCILKCKSH